MEIPVKVLFVIDNLEYGGAQTHFIDLVNNLDKKYQPTVLLLSDNAALASKIKPHIEIHKEIRRWRFDLSLKNRVAFRITEGGYTNIFASSLFAFFIISSARKKFGYDFKINVILHSSQILNYRDFIRRFLFVRYKTAKDTFISTCQFQVQYFARSFHIASRQFKTIYNGIDTDRFTFPPSSFNIPEFKASLGIPDKAEIIIQVATLRKEKAHQYSIEALKILHATGSKKPYLLIVGGGNDILQEELRQLAVSMNIQEYVLFCGMQEELRPYFWISNLFTLSSVAIETFSISALIAMASGLPCVLTDVGGASEMVKHGENGYIVPIRDPKALAQCWSDALDGKISMRSDNIRKLVEEKFSIQSMMHSYESLIR